MLSTLFPMAELGDRYTQYSPLPAFCLETVSSSHGDDLQNSLTASLVFGVHSFHKLYCKIWPGVGLVEALINDLLADLQWKPKLTLHKHLIKVDPVMIIFLLFILTVLIIFGGTTSMWCTASIVWGATLWVHGT